MIEQELIETGKKLLYGDINVKKTVKNKFRYDKTTKCYELLDDRAKITSYLHYIQIQHFIVVFFKSFKMDSIHIQKIKKYYDENRKPRIAGEDYRHLEVKKAILKEWNFVRLSVENTKLNNKYSIYSMKLPEIDFFNMFYNYLNIQYGNCNALENTTQTIRNTKQSIRSKKAQKFLKEWVGINKIGSLYNLKKIVPNYVLNLKEAELIRYKT
uniref:Uncharacterized protein n=1 Tax=viral metagenome TaxID=1070528 RepID=A0A6C0F9A3_9ZZZZ|tara:strand:- start:13491 stop:14126 length:636 start_codon:yes stop_codon:yes gene_type:complete